jgi:hypothetical protein
MEEQWWGFGGVESVLSGLYHCIVAASSTDDCLPERAKTPQRKFENRNCRTALDAAGADTPARADCERVLREVLRRANASAAECTVLIKSIDLLATAVAAALLLAPPSGDDGSLGGASATSDEASLDATDLSVVASLARGANTSAARPAPSVAPSPSSQPCSRHRDTAPVRAAAAAQHASMQRRRAKGRFVCHRQRGGSFGFLTFFLQEVRYSLSLESNFARQSFQKIWEKKKKKVFFPQTLSLFGVCKAPLPHHHAAGRLQCCFLCFCLFLLFRLHIALLILVTTRLVWY